MYTFGLFSPLKLCRSLRGVYVTIARCPAFPGYRYLFVSPPALWRPLSHIEVAPPLVRGRSLIRKESCGFCNWALSWKLIRSLLH